jgi:hypothetical protein
MSTLHSFLFRLFGFDLKELEKVFELLSTYCIPRSEQIRIQEEAIERLLKDHGHKSVKDFLKSDAPNPMPYLLQVLLDRAGWIAPEVFSTYAFLSASYWQLYTPENPVHRLLVHEHYIRPEGIYFGNTELVTLLTFTGEWLELGPFKLPVFQEVYSYNEPPLLVIPAEVEGLVEFAEPLNRWLRTNVPDRTYTLLKEKLHRPLFGRSREELKAALLARI